MLIIKKIETGVGLPEIAYELRGMIDENAALDRIDPAGSKTLVIDCGRVEFLNSVGVKLWRQHFGALRKSGVELRFRAVAPCLMTQTGFIRDFIFEPEIVSVHAPFLCDSCGEMDTVIFPVEELKALDLRSLRTNCKKCSGSAMLDEDPEQFFSIFLSK